MIENENVERNLNKRTDAVDLRFETRTGARLFQIETGFRIENGND